MLTDDNFASIVAAIEQGRIIYSNIRKLSTSCSPATSASGIPAGLGTLLALLFAAAAD